MPSGGAFVKPAVGRGVSGVGGLMSVLECTEILAMAMVVIALLAIWRERRPLPHTNRYDAVLRALCRIATVLHGRT